LFRVVQKLRDYAPTELQHHGSCNGGYRSTINAMAYYVTLLSVLYGKNTHRHVPAFKKLLRLWRTNDVAKRTRAVLTRDRPYYGPVYDRADAWCDWMDKEARARPPKTPLGDTPKLKPLW
jgi:hypothetical protein